MTKHFSFSTNLFFFFFLNFLFMFNIFLINLLFRKKNWPAASSEKKISPMRSDGNKQFCFFGLMLTIFNVISKRKNNDNNKKSPRESKGKYGNCKCCNWKFIFWHYFVDGFLKTEKSLQGITLSIISETEAAREVFCKKKVFLEIS